MFMKNYKENPPSDASEGASNILIFRPYGFENLGFLKNTHRGMMRSSTGTYTDGLDHKKSNSGKSLGTLRF